MFPAVAVKVSGFTKPISETEKLAQGSPTAIVSLKVHPSAAVIKSVTVAVDWQLASSKNTVVSINSSVVPFGTLNDTQESSADH